MLSISFSQQSYLVLVCFDVFLGNFLAHRDFIGIVFALIAVRVHFTRSGIFVGETVMAAMPTWLDDSSSANSSLPSFDPEAGREVSRVAEEEKFS